MRDLVTMGREQERAAALVAFARGRIGDQIEQASLLRQSAAERPLAWRSYLIIAEQLDADAIAKTKLIDWYELTCRLRDEAAARIRAAAVHTASASDLDTWDRASREAAILEDPVKLIVLPHHKHPAYRAEWAVD